MIVTRRAATLLLGAAMLAASGCTSTFRTFYSTGVPAEVSRGWRVSDVRVAVPATLSVSEAKTLLPKADIVWREDPEGDRRAQVAAIVETAARQGASALRGARPVILDITVSRFHALTFEAERRFSNAGVHNIDFTIQVVDAATGRCLPVPRPSRRRCPPCPVRRWSRRAGRDRPRNRRSSPICAPPSRAGWGRVRTRGGPSAGWATELPQIALGGAGRLR